MLKLDTQSIQMIAICTILLSAIFLGYLEFKRLHNKLDSIRDQVKVIEDLNTIKGKTALNALSSNPLLNKSPQFGNDKSSKKQINDLVREIDKCIALLNK